MACMNGLIRGNNAQVPLESDVARVSGSVRPLESVIESLKNMRSWLRPGSDDQREVEIHTALAMIPFLITTSESSCVGAGRKRASVLEEG